VEKHAILDALDYTKGDRTVAAAMLGIGRTTLYRKLKEYGL
jgi:transcriptional regulator of acetoin/glycerol metabolism